MDEVTLIVGDCVRVLRTLPAHSVDCIITSPPYADQRRRQYGGIPETFYPRFTAQWMGKARRVLKADGSIIMVLRPHVVDGCISDYVERTRRHLRRNWHEIDSLIWDKSDSPPLGSLIRPRRAYEPIYWFAPSRRPFCNPHGGGKVSERVGFEAKKGVGDYIRGTGEVASGLARGTDVIRVGVSQSDRHPDNHHPAQFPAGLAMELIERFCPPGGTVCDPFMGSGSTAEAALRTGRHCVGIEIREDYNEYARSRVERVRRELVAKTAREDDRAARRERRMRWGQKPMPRRRPAVVSQPPGILGRTAGP